MSTLTLERTNEKPIAQPRLNYPKVAPATLQAMVALQNVVNRCEIESITLELVKTRASQMNGCAFCIDMHVRDALAAGETQTRLCLLNAWREVDIYTPREKAALHWTEKLTRLAGEQVSDEDFAIARNEFSEAELANLTLAIVTINGWNRFNAGFRVPPGFAG